MINKLKYISSIVILALCITACEEQPLVLPDPPTVEPTNDKVVLIEELTGVRCPNCPSGAAQIETILNSFDKNVAVIGIHGSFLTDPLDDSKYDFRNDDAVELEGLLQPFAKPSAAINRRILTVGGQTHISNASIDEWRQQVVDELEIPREVDVNLTATLENNKIQVEVNVEALKDVTNPVALSVAITQSEIEDPQETNGSEIEDYEHNHVLRKMLTAALGDNIASSMQEGDIVDRTFSFEIPNDPLWNLGHFEVVAFVTNQGATKTVIQAAKKKL